MICEDCFDEFKSKDKNRHKCFSCDPPIEYNVEQCAYIWKVFRTRGFNTREEIDEYQIVKKTYKKLKNIELPKLEERLNK